MSPEKPEPGDPLSPSEKRSETSSTQEEGDPFRKTFPQHRKSAFERELKLLRTLGKGDDAGRFPTVLSYGRMEDGGFYLELKRLSGKNLYQIVASEGPLESGSVLQLLGDLLPILSTLKELGIVHGDLSPSNLFLTKQGNVVLLDFEKARFERSGPIDGETEGFSGGTHGFAPKEAYLGHPPNHAFDLYGLGGILHFLLVGQIPPLDRHHNFLPALLRRLRPLAPAPLLDLCKRLLSTPENRPSLEEIQGLVQVLPIPDQELSSLERHLLGEPASPELISSELQEAFEQELQRRRHWETKLNNLLLKLPQTPPQLSPKERLMGAWNFARVIQICLSHLPLLPLARERLSRASKRIPGLLRELPESFRQLREELQFAEAKYLARLSINLCDLLADIPIDHPNAPRLIAETSQTLHASYKRMEQEEKNLREWERSFQDALGAMHFQEAKRALNKIGEYWSGANPKLAKWRDRLHRAEWLADRILRGKEAVQTGLVILGDKAPEKPEILELIEELETHSPQESSSSYGVNRLTRTLMDYQETFPLRGTPEKGRPNLKRALEELQELRRELTRLCHQYAKQMEEYLQLDPVPLRPILMDLAEADRILFLDCLVDLPEKTRGDLYDQLDRLRLRIEALADQGHWLSARAKDQAERGRLTTALYDMERALKVSRGDEDIEPILSEVERLKQLKQNIASAQLRNRELASLYQRLLQEKADPESIQDCLDKREEVLHYLASNDPGAKDRWKQTLLDLKRTRVETLCSLLEERFHTASSPEEKLKVCETFYLTIDKEEASSIPPSLRDRWRSFEILARREQEQQNPTQRKSKLFRQVLWLALVIVALVLGLLVFPFL
ncbi:MAG TPA: hypothetical protein ENK02_09765 [Planctomycetes bacterium]|nr:hypothetical protein [Planctomycetota bacterium]